MILGTGHHGYKYAFQALERESPNKIRAFMEYNQKLARRLYASGDMILMPSLYEPCGLSQMIAMRYGCVPIAHAVGGLKDTITVFPKKEQAGFLFEKPNSKAFIKILIKALQKFKDKHAWKIIQQNGMKKDFSWNQSARKYAKIYFDLLNK